MECVQVVSQAIIVGNAPIFELIGHNEAVITLMGQLGSVYRFLSLLVALALFLEDVSGDP